MAQRKTAATPVCQHRSYHSAAPIHQYDHGNIATYVYSNLRTDTGGTAQDCSISSASALELPQFHAKLSIWPW